MALKVWLPLNGDLKNKGCSNVEVVNNGATLDSNGKVGECYYFNGSNSLAIPAVILPSQTPEWSFSCWFSLANITSTGAACLFSERTSGTYTGYTIFIYPNSGQMLIDDGVRWSITPMTFSANTWYHLVITRNPNGKFLYIDGILKKSTSTVGNTTAINTNGCLIGLAQSSSALSSGNQGFLGKLNDVRIYDHCLSAAEVKEISKGLVLHYKLNQNFGLTDIIRNQNTYSVYNNFAGSGTTGSITDLSETYQGCPVRRETMTPNDTSLNSFKTGLGSHGVMGHSQTFLANTKYVFWIYYRPVSHTDIQVGGTASNIGGWTAIPSEPVGGGWYRVGQYRSGTVTTDKTDNIFTSFCTPTAVSGSPITIDWAAPHLLSGTTEIPEYDFFMEDKVVDSSGYNHNGTTLNTVEVSSDTPRYNISTNLVNGNSMINCGRGAMVTDSITVNLWIKSSAWANPVSCTEGGGWNFEATGDYFRFPVYLASVGYKYGQTTHTRAQVCDNQWHMLTGIYDRLNQKVQIYVDGELDNEVSTGSSNNIAYNGSNVIWLGAEATGSATAASNGMAGLFSDFRIYCTALSAEDILKLYNTGAKIDNLNSLHTGELVENNSINVEKSTVVHGSNFDENIIGKYLKYDPEVYIEPDGSAWVRVFHHNNPSAGSFASTNTFTTGAYIDENRWFNVNVCDHLDKWEFMIKGRFTVDGEDWKIRWIQNVNPMVATFAQVAATNTTAITNSRGYTYNAKQWGGLWAKKNSAYLTANNGNEGNWWGAVGSYSVYQGGIPGWGYSGHTPITTTGFNDLYVRIDNVEFIDTIASANKSKIWTANHFIER